MRIWVLGSVLLLIWFVLYFLLHKAGFVHIMLVSAISMFVVQLLADRKTRYHQNSAK